MSKERRERAFDVVIVGGGPAGRHLADHLVGEKEKGTSELRIAVVDPAIGEEWPNTYGVWSDELAGLKRPPAVLYQWDQAGVYVGADPGEGGRTLRRGYSLLDKKRWRKEIDGRLREAGAQMMAGKVVGVEEVEGDVASAGEQVVRLEDGEALRARLVVDASGGKSGLVRLAKDGVPGFQSAYGMVARVKGDPLEGASMVLMDFRPPDGARHRGEEPTFLYGMHLGEERYFLEETVLVGREPRGFEALREDLERRLERLGVEVLAIEEEERCLIPMGTALPVKGQSIFAFGAAAGFVHPATGYQISRMLRATEGVARAVCQGLERGEAGEGLVERLEEEIWPQEVRRARDLLLFGQEVLLDMNDEEIGRFFEAFFARPIEDWRTYLGGDAPFRRIAGVMWGIFGDAGMGLRWSMARQAFGAEGLHIMRAFQPRLGGRR